MKKVLILAYDFPPYVSVGGLRPKSWFDYFHEFDIEPIVITRQWSNKHKNELDYIEAGDSSESTVEITNQGTIIRSPYFPNLSNRLLLKYGNSKFKLVRKLISGYYEFVQYLLPIGPKAEVYKTANAYLAQNKVDCILATGDPFVLFCYAKKLSKKYKTPWIADYRDAWSPIFERQNKSIEKAWNTYFEKKTTPSATHVVTVSEFVKRKTKEIVPHDSFTIIPNGFDPISMEKVMSIPQKNDILRIAMIGSIQPWNPIHRFLETYSMFTSAHPTFKVELTFYGVNNREKFERETYAKFPNLRTSVNFTEKLQNEDLLERIAESNVMLLFNYFSFMGTKIFDYIGLKRKILLCFIDDSEGNKLKNEFFPIHASETENSQLQSTLIAETNAGISIKDSDHLLQTLENLADEFISTGQIACNSVHVENYSRKIQTDKLAHLIKSIC